MYLDVQQPVVALLKKSERPYQRLSAEERVRYNKFQSIRERIQERYEESMDTPKHFEKVRWFAQYWSDVIPKGLNLGIRGAERAF
jgi:hypothetical protein